MVQRLRYASVQQTQSVESAFGDVGRRRPSARELPSTSPKKALRLSFFLSILILGGGSTAAQDPASDARSFSLANRAHVDLTADWSVHSDALLPPPPLLIASAPHLISSDLLFLENRASPAVLKLGVSSNPFLGSDATHLDVRMHERLVPDLFYFFFPPPRTCLAAAQASFEEARRKDEERLRREEEEQEKNGTKSEAARQPIVLSRACEFSPIPGDFFAAQLASGLILRETRQGDRVEGRWRNFYLPPMEQVEIKGKTFFVFEARAEQALERGDIEAFGLADDRRGARAHFFWAIGANTPFPFLRDPQRKDLQLIHVVYGALSLDGNSRAEFRKLLDSIAFER